MNSKKQMAREEREMREKEKAYAIQDGNYEGI
jgi:hypothetical protein